jgi:23S rRNA (pseudouridine1915-N3)-methyltransferase
MKVIIAAVGKLKDGPERELFERYRKRFDALVRQSAMGPIKLMEVSESRAASAATRRDEEAIKLMAGLSERTIVVRLDVGGRPLDSAAFAGDLAHRRDDGGDIAFLIGGPDGHGAAVIAAKGRPLSLGPMTLPHGIARVVLVEQLYRAATILIGHPYHRA